MSTQTQREAMRGKATLTLRSPAFDPGGRIPREHTGFGDDVSPELRIGGVPEGTRALALVMDDPDAPGGTFTHWTVWNLPPDLDVLPRGVDVGALGAAQGENDFGVSRYRGPKPPSGTHRYVFRAFALDAKLALDDGAAIEDVWAALARHARAWGEVVGTFTRP